VVHGRTKEEHDSLLARVFKRIKERNLTLNRHKCQLELDLIQFMGHTVSTVAIGPTSERVKAIVGAKPPKCASEIRSFLGLVNFSARYIPNLATISEPLRKLTRKGIAYNWGKEPQNSFEKLMESLSHVETLGHFKLDAVKTTVVAHSGEQGK